MNKQRFIKVLHEPEKIREDIPALKELQKNYPYSQAVHVLVALAQKQKNSEEAGNSLNYAALYVTDRNNLKDIISGKIQKPSKTNDGSKEKVNAAPVKEEVTLKQSAASKKTLVPAETKSVHVPTAQLPEVKESAVQETHKAQKEQVTNIHSSPISTTEVEKEEAEKTALLTTESSDMDEVRERLVRDLQNLQESKRKCEAAELAAEHGNETAEKKAIAKSGKKLKSADKKKITSKAESTKGKAGESTKPAKTLSGNAPKAESPDKIKKQQELISKFIEISPSIKAKANKPPIISSEQEDLSIKSTSFKDNLISENLAEIMISQGKVDKAIDIYKKLIWKFPQKKAYFAARIEELTKQKG